MTKLIEAMLMLISDFRFMAIALCTFAIANSNDRQVTK